MAGVYDMRNCITESGRLGSSISVLSTFTANACGGKRKTDFVPLLAGSTFQAESPKVSGIWVRADQRLWDLEWSDTASQSTQCIRNLGQTKIDDIASIQQHEIIDKIPRLVTTWNPSLISSISR